MANFYGWGSTASRLKPLWGGSLLFTTKFPDTPGTNFIDLGRMKGWVNLGATQRFWTWDPWIRNPVIKQLRLQCGCVPVNFAKFLRTPYLQSTSEQLLLDFFTHLTVFATQWTRNQVFFYFGTCFIMAFNQLFEKGVFLWILRNFWGYLLWRTSVN